MENPVQTAVRTTSPGLQVSIAEAAAGTGDKTAKPGSSYSLLNVEQIVHIDETETDENGKTVVKRAAEATRENPFVLDFNVLMDLLPEGTDPDEVIVYRDGNEVPDCDSDGNVPLPADEAPCWTARSLDDNDGILSIRVLTLQASQWNFAAPVVAPDTAILQAYQGATSAGSPNDPGAPLDPEEGELEGFSFSSDDPDATFECKLTGPDGDHVHAFEDCESGDVEYDVSGTDHPDGLYTFEVRATKDGLTDPTPARRDFVIDRGEVSITLDETPAAQHTSTTASFAYSSNKAGTTYECMIRLQTAAPGDFDDCDDDFTDWDLQRGAAYEFNVRGTDEAENTGTASYLFSITADAVDPGAPPGEDDEDEEDDPDGDSDDDDNLDPVVRGSSPGGSGDALDRIAGATRIATAADRALRFFEPGVPAVYVARSDTFPDALTGGPLAAANGAPILLVDGALPEATARELVRLRVTRVLVVGGPGAVSDAVVARIAALSGAAIERVSGPTRYDTAARSSERAFPSGTQAAFIATGEGFADALTAAPVAAKLGSPLLIVQKRTLPPAIAIELHRVEPYEVLLLGGAEAVAQEVELAINDVLGPGCARADMDACA